MSSRRPHTWDVGERPAVPMPYITLPPYQPSTAPAARTAALAARASARTPNVRAVAAAPAAAAAAEAYLKCDTRERHDRQRRPGNGWASKLHSGTLDYRTVDELGLKPEALDLHSKPATQPPRLTIVDVAANLREEAEGGTKPAFQLEDGRAVRGGVKQFCMAYFKVLVPHKNMTLRVSVNALTGDPDIFVCNRNTHPTQSQHVEVGVRGRRRGDHSGRPALLSRRLLRRRLRHLRLDVRDLRDAHAPARPGAPRHRARGDRVR